MEDENRSRMNINYLFGSGLIAIALAFGLAAQADAQGATPTQPPGISGTPTPGGVRNAEQITPTTKLEIPLITRDMPPAYSFVRLSGNANLRSAPNVNASRVGAPVGVALQNTFFADESGNPDPQYDWKATHTNQGDGFMALPGVPMRNPTAQEKVQMIALLRAPVGVPATISDTLKPYGQMRGGPETVSLQKSLAHMLGEPESTIHPVTKKPTSLFERASNDPSLAIRVDMATTLLEAQNGGEGGSPFGEVSLIKTPDGRNVAIGAQVGKSENNAYYLIGMEDKKPDSDAEKPATMSHAVVSYENLLNTFGVEVVNATTGIRSFAQLGKLQEGKTGTAVSQDSSNEYQNLVKPLMENSGLLFVDAQGPNIAKQAQVQPGQSVVYTNEEGKLFADFYNQAGTHVGESVWEGNKWSQIASEAPATSTPVAGTVFEATPTATPTPRPPTAESAVTAENTELPSWFGGFEINLKTDKGEQVVLSDGPNPLLNQVLTALYMNGLKPDQYPKTQEELDQRLEIFKQELDANGGVIDGVQMPVSITGADRSPPKLGLDAPQQLDLSQGVAIGRYTNDELRALGMGNDSKFNLSSTGADNWVMAPFIDKNGQLTFAISSNHPELNTFYLGSISMSIGNVMDAISGARAITDTHTTPRGETFLDIQSSQRWHYTIVNPATPYFISRDNFVKFETKNGKTRVLYQLLVAGSL